MTASDKERKNIEEHLPYNLLRRLYLNSRISIKQLSEEFGISDHTISKYLKECEDKYKLYYTVDLDTSLLGFSDMRLIAIKFEKVPDTLLLKKRFEKDYFIQNAYFGSGDFNLIIHVIPLSQSEYTKWLFKFRVEFSNYKPKIKVVTLDDLIDGFIPIRKNLVEKSNRINNAEKKIITTLIDNSRIRLKELAKETKLSQMRVIYSINKLKKTGVIKRFTTCVQNPDKRIFLFYTLVITPNKDHHSILLLKLLNKILGEEDERQATTDYSVVSDTSGHFDSVFFCNFKDGDILNSRGQHLFEKVWESEYPITEQCVLTDLIVGKWPFNANSYTEWHKIMEEYTRNPITYDVYK